MNKHYFKYGSGFINIDSENLYITSSGNWQETQELKEKNTKTKRENSFRITGNNIFLFIVFAAVIIGAFLMFKQKGWFMIGTSVAILFFLYKYFQPEMGKRYRIPISKIESVQNFEKGLKIIFRNQTGEPDFEIIDNVEPKGFEILSELNFLKTKALNS